MSIRVKGRPREAVLADMIEGVVVTNGLGPPDADRVRNELWEVMAGHRADAQRPDRAGMLLAVPRGLACRATARVAKLADAGGLNPPAPKGRAGSNPAPGTHTLDLCD